MFQKYTGETSRNLKKSLYVHEKNILQDNTLNALVVPNSWSVLSRNRNFDSKR